MDNMTVKILDEDLDYNTSITPSEWNEMASEIRSVITDTSVVDAEQIFNKFPIAEENQSPKLTPYNTQTANKKRVSYQNEEEVYAVHSSSSNGQIYKSTNTGLSWTEKGSVGEYTQQVYKIEKTGTLIAVASNIDTIYRSSDDGQTWSSVLDLTGSPLFGGITETPDGNILIGEYGSDDTVNYKMYRSSDDGETWESVLTAEEGTPSDAGHFHSIQYDRYANKLIAFIDYPDPEIFESSDDGETWDKISTSTTPQQPNYVEMMFFENHIAWHTDDNDSQGEVYRLTRDDFYNGNWDNSELISKTNEKMGYYNQEIKEGIYVIGWTSGESDGYLGSSNLETHIVYDEGRKISPGLEKTMSDGWEPGELSVSSPLFPNSPIDSALNGTSWLFYYDGSISVPVSVSYAPNLPKITQSLVGDWLVQEGADIQKLNGTFYIKGADGNAEIRLYEQGMVGILYNGELITMFREGRVDINKRLDMDGNVIRNLGRDIVETGSNMTVGETHDIVGVLPYDEITITLSSGMLEGKTFTIKDINGNAGTNAITIDTEGSEEIDGQTSITINADYGFRKLYYDGSNWFVVGSN